RFPDCAGIKRNPYYVFLASGLEQLAESECKTLSRADLQSCAADWDSSAGENGVMRGAVPRIT
ncbi:hypothetical protein, partial [Deinococcus wulumuqiensis]|uniref:hypothetical protein n=1 Tax=Deinococcus wulumuqiensis TaxID=980427 RepID=UPI001CEFA7C0